MEVLFEVERRKLQSKDSGATIFLVFFGSPLYQYKTCGRGDRKRGSAGAVVTPLGRV